MTFRRCGLPTERVHIVLLGLVCFHTERQVDVRYNEYVGTLQAAIY